MPDRREATTFTEQQLRVMIKTLMNARTTESREGRFRKLHERIKGRDDHFYNLPAADQHLPPPHADVEPYQSDVLRQTQVQLKARLTENEYKFRVEPPREGLSKAANDFEKVLNQTFQFIEEREDLDILGDLADGQIQHCYGVLHWQRADNVWPAFPDAEEQDSLADMDETQAKRYEPDGKKFKETAASRLERHDAAKARAGAPYYIEVVRPDQFAFIPDRSLANGFGATLIIRTTGIIQYDEKLKEKGQRLGLVSLNQYRKDIKIYEEQDFPAKYDPSTDPEAWGREILIAQFETRDEGYELMMETGSDGTGSKEWQLVKSWKHHFGMPPAVLARAFYTNHPDPALAYLPALEGGYRLKPFVDKAITLHRAISEQVALPFYYIKQADGSYMIGNDGKPLMLSRNTLTAQTLPPGAEIVAISPDVNPALVESLKMSVEELKEAMPDTGFVEVGASTQPWTIRLSQDQANTVVKMLKKELAKALRTCGRSIASDMQYLGEPIGVYVKTTSGGAVDAGSSVFVDPEDIPSMEIQVDIDPFSNAQAVANIQHMQELLDDPLVPFSDKDFLEQALRKDDPDGAWEEWMAQTTWQTDVWPKTKQQELARRFGKQFVVTPDAQFVGAGGTGVPATDVLAANGYQVQPPQSDGAVNGVPQTVLPSLPTLSANGAAPVPGVPG